MVSKLVMNLILGFTILVSIVNAAVFYDTLQFDFTHDKPTNLKAMTFQCQDSSCTSATPANVVYYKGDSYKCWAFYGPDGTVDPNNAAKFNQCLEGYRLPGNTLNMYDCDTIGDQCSGIVNFIVKYNNINAPFGYIQYFFTSGDNYIPKYLRTYQFNCDYDICMDETAWKFTYRKVAYAVSEIGELNIINTENPLLPVQVEVPVTIEETVCSAFRIANPQYYRPAPPAGYDDFSATTDINLDITRLSTGATLRSETVTIPIEADTCAGLAAFSWTPPAALENEQIKFRVETEVVDEQVVTGGTDWAEVIETIYPIDLDDTCWTRAQDFMLANTQAGPWTTDIAQMMEGEYLYATFKAGAWRDNAVTPMDFEASLYFEGVLIYQDTLSTNNGNLGTYVVNLSSHVRDLPPGYYNVTLVTEPVGTGCIISESVNQTMNLQIYPVETFEVTFVIQSQNFDWIQGADINFELIDEDNYFQVPHIYDEDRTTNANGRAVFDGVYGGTYTYLVEKPGFYSVSNDVHVGADMTIYIVLDVDNTAPVIDLPIEFTEYYQNPIMFYISDYVYDYNDAFEDLTITYQVVSGTGNVNFDGDLFTITTTIPNTVTMRVTVTDPWGASSTDTVLLHFIDNQQPVVDSFYANPDNGPAPLNTNFVVDINDPDGDALTCTIDFGDGSATVTRSCDNMNGIAHNYVYMGTYNVVLTINDGTYTTYAYEQVFVFQTNNQAPVVNMFYANPDNGDAALSTYFVVVVSDFEGDALTCSLDFGDGSAIVTTTNCASLNGIAHTYANAGVYTAILTVNDFYHQVQAFEVITVNAVIPDEPIINYFTMDSSNGNLVPTNLDFDWSVTHPNNLPMTCTLVINSVGTIVPCMATDYMMNNYNVTGLGVFTLIANDGTNQVNMTITMMFARPGDYNLSLSEVDLQIDPVIVPGPFDFTLEVLNETLGQRRIYVMPIINCYGIDNHLNNGNHWLTTMAESSRSLNDGFLFHFNTNTQDFELRVPTDVVCMFKVRITDDFGTDITLVKNVMFQYPEEAEMLTSIRGKGTDVINYMSTALKGQFEPGYNKIQFRLINNENTDKEITITMISQKLGVQYTEEVNLVSGAERTVTIPVYIDPNTEAGMYPVRFAVSDGEDKQVRYSYINVN